MLTAALHNTVFLTVLVVTCAPWCLNTAHCNPWFHTETGLMYHNLTDNTRIPHLQWELIIVNFEYKRLKLCENHKTTNILLISAQSPECESVSFFFFAGIISAKSASMRSRETV